MMGEHDASSNDDELLPRLFRALGPKPVLPAEMRQRWERTFAEALAAQNAARRRLRRRWLSGVAAGAAALFLAALYLQRTVAPLAPVASVALVKGSATTLNGDISTKLRVADEIHAGETVHVDAGAYVAMRYRGADVRLNSNTVIALRPTHLELSAGELYVDAPPRTTAGPPLLIETPFGSLTHVGTQFMVWVDAASLRTAVREGAVAMSVSGERLTISAADGATEVILTDSGTPMTRAIAATGGPWQWVVDAAPQFAIANHSADEFLHWAARQLGAEVRYATPDTRIHARMVRLQGDTAGLSVPQGIAALGATSDLDIDQRDPAVLLVQRH